MHPQIAIFARLADGAAKPTRQIHGQQTMLSRTVHAIAYDELHDEIVVPQQFAQAILTFRGGASGEEPPLRFALGATVDGAARLARGSVEGTLYRVPAERIDDFPRSVSAYRFRELAEFTAADAERFELVFRPEAGEPVTIRGERGESGWTTSPGSLGSLRLGLRYSPRRRFGPISTIGGNCLPSIRSRRMRKPVLPKNEASS